MFFRPTTPLRIYIYIYIYTYVYLIIPKHAVSFAIYAAPRRGPPSGPSPARPP